MLGIFFAFVLVCAFFFSIGFSLGRRTAGRRGRLAERSGSDAGGHRAAVGGKKRRFPNRAAVALRLGDFSFYKAVGEKNADTALPPQDSTAQAAASTAAPQPRKRRPKPPQTPQRGAAASTPAGGYYVQVAAVSRQEDANALVEALKKKQYPAFTANNTSTDKFYHVQVGPYAELKDAEAMRARLISDGYNPIVKK